MHGAGLSTSETLAAQQTSLDPGPTEASPSTCLEPSEEASIPESVIAIAHQTDGNEAAELAESDSKPESHEAEHSAEEDGPGPLQKWERPMTFRWNYVRTPKIKLV